MKKTKIFLSLACAVMLVVTSVMGTMAYLTSTDTVTNTFTVGQVHIKLDEAKIGDDGKALTGDSAERVKENSYHLLPGHEYDKDPTLTVLKVSENSYVRLLVTVTFDQKLDMEKVPSNLDDIFTGYNSNWVRSGAPTVATKTVDGTETEYTVITYEYRYNTTVSATDADNKLPALFTGIKVPGTWTNEDMANIGSFKINVVGQAIQADGFDTADAAWAAFSA